MSKGLTVYFFMQVIGRIILLVLFAYTFGRGEFWPLMGFIAAHVLIIAMVSFWINVSQRGKMQTYQKLRGTAKLFYNVKCIMYSVFCGLGNIYCPNWIVMDMGKRQKVLEISSTLFRELLLQILIIAENIMILVIIITQQGEWSTYYLDNNKIHKNENQIDPEFFIMMFAIVAFGIHFVGVLMKMLYFFCCHIWRDILVTDFKNVGSHFNHSQRKNDV